MKLVQSNLLKQLLLSLLLTTPYAFAAQPQYPNKKADLVAFSYDRPLQLYALLESVELYVTGIQVTNVIYRSSSAEFSAAYDEVKERFPWANFMQQGGNPAEDFKPMVLKATFETPSKYVIFATDDNLVKDYVDLTQCAHLMEENKAYGFYLRLGLHLTECYSNNTTQKVPPINEVAPEVYAWRFANGEGDWTYPNTVDMTLFDKVTLYKNLMLLPYTNPNVFESNWASQRMAILDHLGLCYKETKILNLPLNVVQTTYANRNMQAFSAAALLKQFNAGLKFDIKPTFKMLNKGAHTEYIPNFTQR